MSNTEKLSISQWAVEDRPREKLRDMGAEALTNAELLAILIGSGSARESAVSLMQHVLSDCDNNLNTLGKLSIRQLMEYNGVGEAKAITILAACELGKRRQMEKAVHRQEIGTATDVYNYMHPRMQDLDVEEAWVLLLNQNFKLIRPYKVSHGGLTETAVDVRLIIKEAVLSNATVLVLVHNHPSNSLHPSKSDDQLTDRVRRACDLMRIHFMDHVIITDGAYYSYHEQGRLSK